MPDPTNNGFSLEWRRLPDGSLADFRITRGIVYKSPPLWKRILMPWRYRWRHFIFTRPTVPEPDARGYDHGPEG
jgi:hypothetical protein